MVASLWNVSDLSTGLLMQRFYGYLKSGMSKDEALRSAQLDLLGGKVFVSGTRGRGDGWLSSLRNWLGGSPAPEPLDASHPFYWAAFQLFGDWQ